MLLACLLALVLAAGHAAARSLRGEPVAAQLWPTASAGSCEALNLASRSCSFQNLLFDAEEQRFVFYAAAQPPTAGGLQAAGKDAHAVQLNMGYGEE